MRASYVHFSDACKTKRRVIFYDLICYFYFANTVQGVTKMNRARCLLIGPTLNKPFKMCGSCAFYRSKVMTFSLFSCLVERPFELMRVCL